MLLNSSGTMTTRARRFVVHQAVLLSVVLLLAGCRLYGQGYHPQEQVYQEMLQENDEFAADLARVQQSTLQLGQVPPQDSATARFVRQLQATVAVHQTLLAEHRELASRFSGDEWQYRPIRRAFSAILAEDEMIRLRYGELIRPQVEGDPRLLERWNELPESRYQIAPPYYEHLASLAQVASITGLSSLGEAARADSSLQATVAGDQVQDSTRADSTTSGQ